MSLEKLIKYTHSYGVQLASGRVPVGSREIVHAARVRDTWEIYEDDNPKYPPAPRRVAYFVTNYAGQYNDEYGIVVAIDQAGHPPNGRALADAVFKYYVDYFEAISNRAAPPSPPYGCMLVLREEVNAEGKVSGVVNATIVL